MPIRKVKGGYKWGGHGHVYASRKGAERQAAAAHANGFHEETVKEDIRAPKETKAEYKDRINLHRSRTMKSSRFVRYKKKAVKEETVVETLDKSAPASAWIHDFVHSTNPKFKGKSRKERIHMALGAFYGKQNEERAADEQRINEEFISLTEALKEGDRVVATRNTNAGEGSHTKDTVVKKGHTGTYKGFDQGMDKGYHVIQWDHLKGQDRGGSDKPLYHHRHEFKKA